MLLKLLRSDFLVLLTLGFALVYGARLPEYCAECEEEIWEEVPCSQVPSSTPTPPIASSQAPTTIVTTTMAPPTTTPVPTQPPSSSSSSPLPSSSSPIPPTLPPPIYSPVEPIPSPPNDNSNSYNKCYCECKLGCKEFCRKVVLSGPKQQITQISSTADDIPGAQMEYTHVHQRKYYPNPQLPSSYGEASALPNPLERSSQYSNSAPPTQPLLPSVQESSLPLLPSDSYSIDDITKLLQSDAREYQNPSPSLPLYYSPFQLAPVYNKVDNVLPSSNTPTIVPASIRPSNYGVKQNVPATFSDNSKPYPLSYSGSLSETPQSSFEYAVDNYLKKYIYGVSGQVYDPYANY